jgi:hypothetical protein
MEPNALGSGLMASSSCRRTHSVPDQARAVVYDFLRRQTSGIEPMIAHGRA